MRSKLDETDNLISLYVHHVGKSEVPKEFHFWGCLSAISASVADRVYLEKFRGSKLLPNLYCLLLGPSGLGKGVAIETAIKFIKDIPRVNCYRGKATAQYLVDYLGKGHKNEQSGKWVIENTKLYLVTPELSMSVGSGPLADSFIKHMTELYSGGDYLLQEGTRTRGGVQIKNPCVNWFGGTTIQWLKDSVTRDAIEGGFFARCVTVAGHYNFAERYRRPEYPADYDAVCHHMMARFKVLTHLEGRFEMTTEAQELESVWYDNRAVPESELLLPAWKREHDLVLKLSMILSLAEGDLELVITKTHMHRAQIIAGEVMRSVPMVIDFAAQDHHTEHIKRVQELIRKNKRILHSQLLRISGLSADKLREAADTLQQRNQISRGRTDTNAMYYQWMDTRRMPQ